MAGHVAQRAQPTADDRLAQENRQAEEYGEPQGDPERHAAEQLVQRLPRPGQDDGQGFRSGIREVRLVVLHHGTRLEDAPGPAIGQGFILDVGNLLALDAAVQVVVAEGRSPGEDAAARQPDLEVLRLRFLGGELGHVDRRELEVHETVLLFHQRRQRRSLGPQRSVELGREHPDRAGVEPRAARCQQQEGRPEEANQQPAADGVHGRSVAST